MNASLLPSAVSPPPAALATLSRRAETAGAVSIQAVTIRYGTGPGAHLAMDGASLEIAPGEFVCVLGPSGCGKSTLLNCVAGYVSPAAGRVLVDGVPVTQPGPERGMVFQQYSLFRWKTVLENVAFGPRMTGQGRAGAIATARTFLEMVGLSAYADRYPHTLSGGMQQRVGIARALANYPAVLLMDEPFGALDAQTRAMMQESLLGIRAQIRNTVLFVTHDVEEALFLADRVIVMSAAPGRILADRTVPFERPRTADLLTSAEFVAHKKWALEIIREQSLKAFAQQTQREQPA